jgi:DnaK suppressor protein
MNKEEREVLKQKIKEELKKLSAEREELKELVKPIAPENAIGRVSRMDAINNKSINEAALQKVDIRLEALKLALGNIDSEEYGICVRCGKEIPLGRLLLRPQSRSCVACAH